MTDGFEDAYINSLLPTPEEEYADRVEATLLRRLIERLRYRRVLSESDIQDLLTPTVGMLDEAER